MKLSLRMLQQQQQQQKAKRVDSLKVEFLEIPNKQTSFQSIFFYHQSNSLYNLNPRSHEIIAINEFKPKIRMSLFFY